jgi:hypothetical protein
VGVGWFGASGTLTLSHQLLWAVLAITGAAVAAVMQGMFVLDAFRVIKARRLAIMTDLAALAPAGAAAESRVVATDDVNLRVAAAAMTHYHRPYCMLVDGKDVSLHGSADEHAAAGRTACGVCGA